MALDESVFADLQAAQGDFGSTPTAGVAGFPQGQVPLAQPQVPTLTPPAQQAVQTNPADEMAQHPVFQFYDQWKKSSPEMRKTAEAKISADFPSPEAMGLPPTPGVTPKVDKETGKPQADPSSWGKFMKFIDSNPKMLLDLGATLLGPKKAGQSDFSHMVSGLQGATARMEQRRRDKTALDLSTKKTEAGIAGTEALTSETPSKIALREAQAKKALRPTGKADKTLRAKQYANALRQNYPDLFATDAKALIKAEEMLAGKQTSYDKFVSKFVSDNLVFFGNDPVKAGEAAKLAAGTLGLEATQSLEDMDKAQQAAAIKKNPNLLYDYLAKTYPEATHEQIQAKVKAVAGKASTRKSKTK